jgi:chromate reductase, NAD(P)H dehydrogenase (quinone)
MTVIGLTGSLRKKSFNTSLLRAAATFVSAGTILEVVTLHGIPLYDGDVEETEGVPSSVQQLKDRVAAADGLLLATPEYNNSIPGVFKNAFDWMSRPPTDVRKVFFDRPVAVMGATPGLGGTGLAQAAWLPIFRTLRMRPWFGERLQVSNARAVFDEEGNITDEKIREQLRIFIAGFENFVGKK